MSAWLFVLGDRSALEWVLENRTMAFRDHIRATGIAKGDRFAMYVTRGAFRNPTRDRAQVIAVGTVAGPLSTEPVVIADEEFRQSVRIEFDEPPLQPRQGADFAELVPDLQFIRKKATWQAYVRKALAPIPEGDVDVLSKAITRHRAATG